jgi:WD40 repeat protein
MRSLAIDERHNILALGGDDCHLRLFTLQLAPIRTFRAHNHGTVAAISLDAKRGRVATGGTDGAVKVWRIDGDGGWSVFRHTAYLGSVHLLTDRLISDGFNNVVCCHVFE